MVEGVVADGAVSLGAGVVDGAVVEGTDGVFAGADGVADGAEDSLVPGAAVVAGGADPVVCAKAGAAAAINATVETVARNRVVNVMYVSDPGRILHCRPAISSDDGCGNVPSMRSPPRRGSNFTYRNKFLTEHARNTTHSANSGNRIVSISGRVRNKTADYAALLSDLRSARLRSCGSR